MHKYKVTTWTFPCARLYYAWDLSIADNGAVHITAHLYPDLGSKILLFGKRVRVEGLDKIGPYPMGEILRCLHTGGGGSFTFLFTLSFIFVI